MLIDVSNQTLSEITIEVSDKKISEHLANIFVKQVQLPLLLYNIRHTYDKDKYLFRVLHQLPSRARYCNLYFKDLFAQKCYNK